MDDYKTTFTEIVESMRAGGATSKAVKPAPSVAAKASKDFPNAASSSEVKKTKAEPVKPQPANHTTEKNVNSTKSDTPKKVVSTVSQVGKKLGSSARHFARETENGLKEWEGQLNAWIDKLDQKIRGK